MTEMQAKIPFRAMVRAGGQGGGGGGVQGSEGWEPGFKFLVSRFRYPSTLSP